MTKMYKVQGDKILKNLFTYSLTHLLTSKKAAFTLAEVLITLAIIGVVAAMTIPTLISNYKKQATETKIKRFYSIMTQAISLSEIDNGSALNWEKPAVTEDKDAQKQNTLNYWDKYLAPYIKTVHTDTLSDEDSNIVISLNDGSQFKFNNGACMHFMYYPNGYVKDEDLKITDMFHFLQCTNSHNSVYHSRYPNRSFGCYDDWSKKQTTREKALAACTTSSAYCTCLLEFDNWEFKEDYPYKF